MPTRDEMDTHSALQEGGRAAARYLPQIVRALEALTEQLIVLNERLRENAAAPEAAEARARLAVEDDERVPRGEV